MKGLFSPDNPVIRFFIWLGYIWWLNILWLICSLPVVTIGPSTTALIYSCMKLKKDEGYPTKNFFKSFKENFRQASLIWLIYLAVGALIVLGLIFWNNVQIPGAKLCWAVVIAVGIFYVISLMYVFAIQSKFVNSIKDTIRFSVLVAFANLKDTFLIFCVFAGVVLANIFTTLVVNVITLFVGMGIITYLLGIYYAHVFEKYIPAQDYPDAQTNE